MKMFSSVRLECGRRTLDLRLAGKQISPSSLSDTNSPPAQMDMAASICAVGRSDSLLIAADFLCFAFSFCRSPACSSSLSPSHLYLYAQ